MTLREAWRMGRTKIGVGIFGAIVLLAVVGPWIAPYSPTEFVAPPFSPPAPPSVAGQRLHRPRRAHARALRRAHRLPAGPCSDHYRPRPRSQLGLIAGYARRWIDEGVMRILDVVLAFPQIVLTLLFVSIVGPKLWLIVLMVGISHAPRIARVARAATLEVSQRDFVRAAEAFGIARWKILFNEIMPSITSPLLVEFGLRLTYSIGLIAALSFLGFGMQPPAADWGLMINENRIGIMIQPWPVFVPVLLIGILTIGTNLIADGLGRALIGIERDTGVG